MLGVSGSGNSVKRFAIFLFGGEELSAGIAWRLGHLR
jgi:hypothetical protein